MTKRNFTVREDDEYTHLAMFCEDVSATIWMEPGTVLIFAPTPWAASHIYNRLGHNHCFRAGVIHSDMSCEERELVLQQFKNGKYDRVLVTTDSVAPEDLQFRSVFSYKAPTKPSSKKLRDGLVKKGGIHYIYTHCQYCKTDDL